MLSKLTIKKRTGPGLLFLEELIFPRKCICCKKYNQPDYLCRGCLSGLTVRSAPECIVCGAISKDGEPCRKCKDGIFLDKFFVASRYSDKNLVTIIKAFKYRFIKELANPLSELVAKYITKLNRTKQIYVFEKNPILIPVPLYFRRYNWRGFNQAELIAINLAHSFQLKVENNALIRRRDVSPQADLGYEERRANVKGAFYSTGKVSVKGKDIVLIDDICTTGSTLNECARALKRMGAGTVYGLVLAKG